MIIIRGNFSTKTYTAESTNGLTIGGGGTSFNCAELNSCTTIQELVADKHTHANKSTLDAITEAFTTGLKTDYDSTVTWISTNGTILINEEKTFKKVIPDIANPANNFTAPLIEDFTADFKGIYSYTSETKLVNIGMGLLEYTLESESFNGVSDIDTTGLGFETVFSRFQYQLYSLFDNNNVLLNLVISYSNDNNAETAIYEYNNLAGEHYFTYKRTDVTQTDDDYQKLVIDFFGNVTNISPSGGVDSVFGRTGAVTAEIGDYTALQVGAIPTGGLKTVNNESIEGIGNVELQKKSDYNNNFLLIGS